MEGKIGHLRSQVVMTNCNPLISVNKLGLEAHRVNILVHN